jgi:hypothetical protein
MVCGHTGLGIPNGKPPGFTEVAEKGALDVVTHDAAGGAGMGDGWYACGGMTDEDTDVTLWSGR